MEMTDVSKSPDVRTSVGAAVATKASTPAAASRDGVAFWARDGVAFAVVILLLIGLWYVFSLFSPAYIAPSPRLIFDAIVDCVTRYGGDIGATLMRLLVALAFSLIVGTAIGVAMATHASARPYLRALVMIDTGIPALSWMLIAIFWFKEPETRIFFIMTVILIPFYALSIYDGIRALPKELLDMSESFRPTRGQMLRLVILPHIVPYILLTTKSIVGYASRMVVFAELIGATKGVGAKMGLAQANFEMTFVLSWTVILVVFNLLAQRTVALVESRLLRWRPEIEVR